MLPAEDYDLWSRMAQKKEIRFANLPVPLLRYRINEGKGRSEYKQRQRDAADRVRLNLLHSIGLKPTNQEFAAHRALAAYEKGLTTIHLWQCLAWLKKFCSTAISKGKYNKKTLKDEVSRRVLHICGVNRKNFFAFFLFFVLRVGILGKRMIELDHLYPWLQLLSVPTIGLISLLNALTLLLHRRSRVNLISLLLTIIQLMRHQKLQ